MRSSSRKRAIPFGLFLLLAFFCSSANRSEASDRKQVLEAIERMKSHFRTLEDYSCEVETIYFQNGEEARRIFFSYSFRKDGRIRIDFSYPQSGTSLFFRKGDANATIMPIRALPMLKFRFSTESPLLKTFTGQRIDQTDMEYFIDFLDRSLAESRQPDFDFTEEQGEAAFWLAARDYLQGKTPEKYRIALSREIWLPLRIERYSLDNVPIEKSRLHNYILNARPGDAFFLP